MNRRLASAIIKAAISLLALTLCVQSVKSEPYIDEQAEELAEALFMGLIALALIAIAILCVLLVLLRSHAKHRRRIRALLLFIFSKIPGTP